MLTETWDNYCQLKQSDWLKIEPIEKDKSDCRLVVIGFEGSNLEEGCEEHDEGHLVPGPVVNPGRVPETVGQVDADFVDAGVVSRFENFL